MPAPLRPNPFSAHTVPVTICGVSELPGHARTRISHMVSILDPGTPDPAIFTAYAPHKRLSLRFHDHVHEASGDETPQEADVARILEFGAGMSDEQVEHLLVHCWMGVSRSTAATTIILAQHMPAGREAAAFARLRAVRPKSWPNARMIRFADRLLGRAGALHAALTAHHQWVLEQHPDIPRMIGDYGRPNRPGE